MSQAVQVFISYSHKDDQFRQELDVHLSMLKRQGIIDVWHDRRIVAGDEIDQTISNALETADLVLLLVSPDFLNSNYCYQNEMLRAMERHKSNATHVVPIIVRPCDWTDTPFAGLKATPTDAKAITKWPNKDEAYLEVVKEIKAVSQRRGGARKQSRPTQPAAPRDGVPPNPRSSNLRVTRKFTEADRDAFLEEAFEYLARFFDGSLDELAKRNQGIDVRFRRQSSMSFTAVVYRHGEAQARCRIFVGTSFGSKGEILYSNDDRETSDSYNDRLRVVEGDQSLGLTSGWGGMPTEEVLTFEGAAEHYWGKFIDPLQDQRHARR